MKSHTLNTFLALRDALCQAEWDALLPLADWVQDHWPRGWRREHLLTCLLLARPRLGYVWLMPGESRLASAIHDSRRFVSFSGPRFEPEGKQGREATLFQPSSDLWYPTTREMAGDRVLTRADDDRARRRWWRRRGLSLATCEAICYGRGPWYMRCLEREHCRFLARAVRCGEPTPDDVRTLFLEMLAKKVRRELPAPRELVV